MVLLVVVGAAGLSTPAFRRSCPSSGPDGARVERRVYYWAWLTDRCMPRFLGVSLTDRLDPSRDLESDCHEFSGVALAL